ncbi:hypothetical protein F4778DRAFT_516793 [Xylariomycetidae sp. FL2044]|nr:hypothetical protein F4778DRAFT_516793 [Xylariomycetidae sp. FL2044]
MKTTSLPHHVCHVCSALTNQPARPSFRPSTLKVTKLSRYLVTTLLITTILLHSLPPEAITEVSQIDQIHSLFAFIPYPTYICRYLQLSSSLLPPTKPPSTRPPVPVSECGSPFCVLSSLTGLNFDRDLESTPSPSQPSTRQILPLSTSTAIWSL